MTATWPKKLTSNWRRSWSRSSALDRPRDGDARVVDETGEPAAGRLGDLGGRGGDRVGVGDVDDQRLAAAPEAAATRASPSSGLRTPAKTVEAGAVEAQRAGPADPGGGAGDDDGAATHAGSRARARPGRARRRRGPRRRGSQRARAGAPGLPSGPCCRSAISRLEGARSRPARRAASPSRRG